MNLSNTELDVKVTAELTAWFEKHREKSKLSRCPWRTEIAASCISGVPDTEIISFLRAHGAHTTKKTMRLFRVKLMADISQETKEAILASAKWKSSETPKSEQLQKSLTTREVNQKVVNIVADVIVSLQQEKERGNNTLSDKRLELLSKYCQQYVELNDKLEKDKLESERGDIYKQVVSEIGKIAAGYITDDKFKVEFLQKIEVYLQEHC